MYFYLHTCYFLQSVMVCLLQEDCEPRVTNDSGYSSIAESASSVPSAAPATVSQRKLRQSQPDRNIPQEVTAPADLEKIEEKISEIFDSMNIGNSINYTPGITVADTQKFLQKWMTRLEVRRCSLEDQQVDLGEIKEERPCQDISRTGQRGWGVSRTRINRNLTGEFLIKLGDVMKRSE